VARPSAPEVPGRLAEELSRALGVLHSASDTRDGLAARQAADAARSDGTVSDMAILTTIWDHLDHAISTAAAEDISQALAATQQAAEGGDSEACDRPRARAPGSSGASLRSTSLIPTGTS